MWSALQQEKEKESRSADSSATHVVHERTETSVGDTLYGQYGRNPKHVRRHPPHHGKPKKSVRFVPKNRLGKDGQRLKCFRCGSDEHLLNKCKPGAIRSHIRDKVKKGTPTINLVHELVLGMEGEPDACVNSNKMDHDLDGTESDESTSVHYQTTTELDVFDSFFARTHGEDSPAEDGENDAEAYFTNYISARFSAMDCQVEKKTLPITTSSCNRFNFEVANNTSSISDEFLTHFIDAKEKKSGNQFFWPGDGKI